MSLEPPTSWSEVATFGEGGGWDFATAVAVSGRTFLGIGSRIEAGYEDPIRVREHLWTSTDGRSWDEVPLGPEFEGVLLQDVIAARDGGFVVFGMKPEPETPGRFKNVVMHSLDGRSWQEVETGLGLNLYVERVVRGALGYLLLAPQFGFHLDPLHQDPSLWLSADGLHWEEVHHFTQDVQLVQVEDIGAGDEGFVAFGVRIAANDQGQPWERFAFASADGREWIDAPQPLGLEDSQFRPEAILAPLGPDWIAQAGGQDGGIQMWFSANGLDWAPQLVPGMHGRYPALITDGQRLYFASDGRLAFVDDVTDFGLWSSTDGRQWTALDLGEGVVVSDAAGGPGMVVLAGATFAADGSTATFWLGPED